MGTSKVTHVKLLKGCEGKRQGYITPVSPSCINANFFWSDELERHFSRATEGDIWEPAPAPRKHTTEE